ncbi:Hypothetical predicted protein [Marmota monax]|uniref:Uncharacterized protein n=1 Tax=Marmota monax TaxID=9995 RepID=A0A5E4BVS8_MARMO|nr:Hypothetical predicted protein [Marmota monax]
MAAPGAMAPRPGSRVQLPGMARPGPETARPGATRPRNLCSPGRDRRKRRTTRDP